jgi:hydroxyquinol 1,2-dioxygenase
MNKFDEKSLMKEALLRLENTKDPRLKKIMEAFTRHMFAFISEVKPSEAEWMQAIEFLTATGQKCDKDRQEWILFSDVFGLTILVDHINHQKENDLTESSVLGPFDRENAPEYENGQSISKDQKGEPTIISGKVTDQSGTPICGAKVDVWQTAPNGLYEVQDSSQPEFNLCGIFTTDAEGRYEVHTVKPVSYPIPTDGPVGALLDSVGRHPNRPAHVHFIASAEGYKPVTAQLFTEGDTYLDSDPVFGVKDSLVVSYLKGNGVYSVEFDISLGES